MHPARDAKVALSRPADMVNVSAIVSRMRNDR
jgi:hypothetical protein